MPDPFGGAATARDAEIARRKIEQAGQIARDLFGVPSTSVVGDPQRRAGLERGLEHGAELTALAAAITLTIPGRLGRLLSGLAVGAEKDPNSGSIRTGPSALGNAAPAPIGYIDPAAYGLAPNFYLPPRITQVIPREADRIGFGLPQQRRQDEANAAAREAAEIRQRIAAARAAVANESDATLEDILAGRGGFNRAGQLFASGVPHQDLVGAAFGELQRRRMTIEPPAALVAPAPPSADTPEAVASHQARERLLAANPPDP